MTHLPFRASLVGSARNHPAEALTRGRILSMSLDDYKVVLYRNQPDGWVAEIPAIPGCHVLMATQEDALVELAAVFRLISEEYEERKQPLPADTTEIVPA